MRVVHTSAPKGSVVKVGSQQSKTASAATRRRTTSSAAHLEQQNPLYVMPWALMLAGGALGQAFFFLWGDGKWMYLPQLGMVVSTAVLAYTGWLSTKARTSLALGHTLVTIALSGLWLILCSVTGMVRLERVEWARWRFPVFVHPTFDLFIIVGCSLAFAWCMRMGVHAKEARDAALAGETMDEWGEAGVPGVRGKLRRKNEYFLEGYLTIPRGMSLSDLQHRAKAIESAHDWPLNSLKLLPGPRGLTSRRVKASVMIKDPLANGAPWPGIERKAKLTLFDEIKEGMRADGEISTLFVARPEGTKHALVQGMSGSGKTEGAKPILLECAYRGAVQIVIDIISGVQMFGSIAPALQWLIADEGTAKGVIRQLAEEVIPARMEQLAREKKRTWDPTSSLKLLRVHIEEAWSLLDADELMNIAVTARKAGVQLTISLQRASHDQLNTTVREQLGTRMCYGLGGSFGTMILDDEVLDAGANPQQWKDEVPGMHYLTRGGLNIEEKATATRSFYDSGKVTFESEALTLKGKISEMDEITAEAFGPFWVQHLSPEEVVARAENPTVRRRSTQPAAAVNGFSGGPQRRGVLANEVPPGQYHPIFTQQAPTATMVLDDDDEQSVPLPNGVVQQPDHNGAPVPAPRDGADGEEDEVQLIMGPGGSFVSFKGPDGVENLDFGPDLEDPAPDVQVIGDPFDFVPGDRPADRPPIVFGGNREKVSKEDFERMLNVRLEELRAQRQIIAAGDFADAIVASGWARTNVYNFLNKLKDGGQLVRVTEGYLFVRK